MPATNSSNPVVWLTANDIAVDFATPPGVAATGRVPLTSARIVIFVGLTGAGKSATVSGLCDTGAVRAVLPDRRAITDSIILPAMTGDPTQLVTDRIERFRLTAAFRDAHPGGMGDVLERLTIDRNAAAAWIDDGWLIFDGVRGRAEAAAAARLPNAVFAVLQAPPEIRVARLSLRGDPFDQAAFSDSAGDAISNGARDGNAGADEAGYLRTLKDHGVNGLVPEPTLQRLARLLTDADADLNSVAAAASIVVEESRHYDPGEAITVLQDRAPSRTLIVNTAQHGVDDVVSMIGARLVGAG